MPFEFKGSATSQTVEVPVGKGAVAVRFPASVAGTSFEVHGSFTGDNFFPIYVDGVKLTINFVASSLHMIRPSLIFGIPYLRLVSTASETTSINVHFADIVK